MSISKHMILTIALSSILVGCQSAPRPRPLLVATDQLTSAPTHELEQVQPALVARSRELTRQAHEAHRRGDQERASLLATQALQSLQTARNYAARDQARALSKAYPEPVTDDATHPRTSLEEQLAQKIRAAVALRDEERADGVGARCLSAWHKYDARVEFADDLLNRGELVEALELVIMARARFDACMARPPEKLPPGAGPAGGLDVPE